MPFVAECYALSLSNTLSTFPKRTPQPGSLYFISRSLLFRRGRACSSMSLDRGEHYGVLGVQFLG